MRKLYGNLRRLIPQLPPSSRRFIYLYMVATSLLSLLDMAALGLLALIMTPMLSGASISVPILGTIGEPQYPLMLILICALMILKAMLALGIQWVATRKLSSWDLELGDILFRAYIRAPWMDRLQRKTQDIVRMADGSVTTSINGVLLPAMQLPSLAATAVTILAVLLVADPFSALVAFGYLGLIGLFLYLGVSRRAVTAGDVTLRYQLKLSRTMYEMVASMKEITLRDRFSEVSDIVHETRVHAARARANLQFLGAVPQRVLEGALVGGFLIVGAASYLTGGMTAAISSIAIFGIAGFRLVPSIVNFQAIMTNTSSNMPHLEIILRDIESAKEYVRNVEILGRAPLPENAKALHLSEVGFSYPSSRTPAVTNLNLDIEFGQTVGLVGSSGAGKSTLVDILLGLLPAQEGTIDIDGVPLQDALAAWRRRVGYVPQAVALFDGTIAQNVALSWGDDIDEEQVHHALELAQLSDFVAERPGGIHAVAGEGGRALSGGQRQRLGIARALYSDPLVLVLDEATSALDSTTEQAVEDAIAHLAGNVTVIAVAHRLSTIRHSDMVCFMRDGEITSRGTFDELVELEPEFRLQAQIAGLLDSHEDH